LGVEYTIINIDNQLESMSALIPEINDISYENLQARIRSTILMSISGSTGRALITTGNKSEYSTGYATLYGDMCGAFNPIKDLYKSKLFEIAKYRNKNIPHYIDVQNKSYPVMPDNVITKAPSAELREGQKDSDSLPEYDILDQILEFYIEDELSISEIKEKGYDLELVEHVINLLKKSEFKRWQAAPGIKLSSKSFGQEWRYPIA
jgi:NAD+ synthase